MENTSASNNDARRAFDEEAVSLFHLGKALGDTFFLSTVAHEIKRVNESCAISIQSHWPELFTNNPDVAKSSPIIEPRVPEGIAVSYDSFWPPRRHRHILRSLCDSIGLDGDGIDPRPHYSVDDEERRHARELAPRSDRPLVVIHPFSGFFAARTKQWDFSEWKRLLEILPEDVETLRFSNVDEPATPLERVNHRDIQTTDVRLMASLLEQADVFLGHDSGLAHLAKALEKPAVVIFTGYVPPDVFGYDTNVNLAPDLPYAPCWNRDGCEPCGGVICTRSVTPEEVLDALLALLERVT